MISSLITNPINRFAREQLDSGHITVARMANLVAVPSNVITRTLDAAIGIVVGVGAICTGGLHKSTYKLADDQLRHSNFPIASSFDSLLKAIHPGKQVIIHGYAGPLTTRFNEKLTRYAQTCSNSKNIFKAHLLSRATYVVLALVSLVTRAVDGVIGVVAGIGSLVTLGKFVSLNMIAFKGLQAPGVIQDIFNCAVKILNPWATTAANYQ